MPKTIAFLLLTLISLSLLSSSTFGRQAQTDVAVPAAAARVYNDVKQFGVLPSGAPGNPEGLWADIITGDVYSASFELVYGLTAPAAALSRSVAANVPSLLPKVRKDAKGAPLPPYTSNFIYTFGPHGALLTSTPLPPGVVPLGVTAIANKLYVNDLINGNEIEYLLPLTSTSVPNRTFTVCGGFATLLFGAPGTFCALNANYVGPDGRVYMSDNGAGQYGEFKGRVWVLDPKTGASSIFTEPSQLDVGKNASGGPLFPPYGVNGIAFSRDGAALYMANMSTSTIYKLTLTNCDSACEPGVFSTFVNGQKIIKGPDNMDFDAHGNLWIASGQNNSVVAVDPQGQIIKQVGSFGGFYPDGSPIGLLQPSGIGFAYGKIFIGNESSQGLVPPSEPIDWSLLKLYTVSSINPEKLLNQ